MLASSSHSYKADSLLSLRSQARSPSDASSAHRLNLWLPTAQRNSDGHTQPFPFDAFINGIGSIAPPDVTKLFDTMSDWNDQPPAKPVGDWGATADQPPNGSMHNSTANEIKSAEPGAEAVAGESVPERKASLADLSNGDREAVVAHLAQRLGPHQLLPRYRASSAAKESGGGAGSIKSDVAPLDGDSAPVTVDSSAFDVSVDDVVQPQTAPDTAASHLFSASSVVSVADQDASDTPKPVRKPAPHHKSRQAALAQNVPLPASPAPAPALAPTTESSAIDTNHADSSTHESSESQQKPLMASIQDDSDSDTSAHIIVEHSDLASSGVVVEHADAQQTKTDDKHTNRLTEDNLNPTADAWVPEVQVEYLPPSCPVSPTTPKHLADEIDLINQCFALTDDWLVPTATTSFADGDLFDGPVLGGIHKSVLAYYSHYFATCADDQDHQQLISDPCFVVFRQWVFGRTLHVKAADDDVQVGKHIDLKTLVQLWRFGARIQAPMFANMVADTIMAKRFSANDLLAAADDIDALLKTIVPINPFCIAITHAVIINDLLLEPAHYDAWPKSLLWALLSWLGMGKSTAVGTKLFSSAHPCAYHLHPVSHTCKS